MDSQKPAGHRGSNQFPHRTRAEKSSRAVETPDSDRHPAHRYTKVRAALPPRPSPNAVGLDWTCNESARNGTYRAAARDLPSTRERRRDKLQRHVYIARWREPARTEVLPPI